MISNYTLSAKNYPQDFVKKIVDYFSAIPFYSDESAIEKLKQHRDIAIEVDLRACLIEENHIDDIANAIEINRTHINIILFPQNFINYLSSLTDSEVAQKILTNSSNQLLERDKKFIDFYEYCQESTYLNEFKTLDEDFKLILTDALTYYAQYDKYFYICARILFELALINVGSVDAKFVELFYCSGSYSNVLLDTKSKALKKLFTDVALEEKDVTYKNILITLLEAAADPTNTGETFLKSADYETGLTSYIRRSIDLLNKLVEHNNASVINLFTGSCVGELIGDMPEYIVKIFSKNAQDIEFYKSLIADQLISSSLKVVLDYYPFHALFVVDKFNLIRSARNQHKICHIEDYLNENQFTLHERQSLAERLIFKGVCNIEDISRGYPKLSYLIINFGLVITDSPLDEGNYKREFISIPIHVDNQTIYGNAENRHEHAEEAFRNYVLSGDNIKTILQNLMINYGIKSQGHKAYGAIFDMHSTYDMCVSCYFVLFKLLEEIKPKLMTELRSFGVSCSLASRFSMVIRYSSDKEYHYPASTELKMQGAIRFSNPRPLAEIKNDIGNSEPILILHSSANWLNFWGKKIDVKEKIPKKVKLENWTAFSSASGCYGKLKDKLNFNYTRLGYALCDSLINNENEVESKLTPEVQRLSL